MANERTIWNFLKAKGLTDAGTAGILGNMYAESGLNPKNLQNSYETKLGYNDESYTQAVDNGSYTAFSSDLAGFGLVQWTYWSRKRDLLAYAKSCNKSIGDLNMQLEFLYIELSKSYKSLLKLLKTTNSITEASDAVLTQFERPANQGSAVKLKRQTYSQNYYNQFVSAIGNSSLVSYTRITNNKTTLTSKTLNRITIHCFVGQVTAKRGVDYFATTKNKCSANYVVGYDGSIGLSVEEKDRSWCSSSGENDKQAITIEVASETTKPYKVTDKAYQALLDLIIDICRRNGKNKVIWNNSKTQALAYKPKDNEIILTVHRWFATKACPGDYLYSLHSEIASTVTAKLNNQKEETKKEDEEMTQEQFNIMMNNWIAEQANKDPSSWSAEARSWAEKNGLITGDSQGRKLYKKPLTREEFTTVLYRALHRNIIGD